MDEPTSPEAAWGTSLWLWIIGGLVLVVIVAGALVAVLRPPAPLDPASPEGTVQSFLLALEEGDYEQAHSLLTTELQDGCRPSDLSLYQSEVPRTVVTSVQVSGQTARIEVTMTFFSGGGPFGGGSYDMEEAFSLIQEEGRWVIDRFPWPYVNCEVLDK